MEREARRKKIASRETDRIALITGRINKMDPSLPKSSSFSTTNADQIPTAHHTRSSSEPVFEDYPHGGGGGGGGEEDICEALIKVSNDKKESAAEKGKGSEVHVSRMISAREIHFSILSSERSRVLCSFAIALLVVLSHMNLPHKLINPKSIIEYRPLYALLLTNLMIVTTRIALYSHGKRKKKRSESGRAKIEKDVENWDGAVTLLEWGLMVHQALRALFIDSTFYLAIVICGLSLLDLST